MLRKKEHNSSRFTISEWVVHIGLLEESSSSSTKTVTSACGAHQVRLCFHWMGSTRQGQGQSVCCLPITLHSRFAELFFPFCSHVSLPGTEFPGALFSCQCSDFLSCPCTQHWGSAAWLSDSPALLLPGCICWWQNSCIQNSSCSYWRKEISLSLPKGRWKLLY